MKIAFLTFGMGLCLLFGYAGFTGWTVTDTWAARTWGATGQSSFNHK